MFKLTKAQRKDRERIECWIAGQPFRENSRAKPAVPVLDVDDVLRTYVPPAIQDLGQYFTPGDMARAAFYDLRLAPGQPQVLEPCAGIGHLLLARPDLAQCQVTAYELSQECFTLGQRLVPWANWRHGSPWDQVAELEGRFDVVLANPPFGITCGLYGAAEHSQSGAKRSEHLFLEFGLRALKPGGRAIYIAPYNFISGVPKVMRGWLDETADVENGFPVPGEFRFTKISVCAHHLRKL